MLKKSLLLILITCFLCTPAIGKSLLLCEFPWGPEVSVDRVAVFFDERVYDIGYFGVKQNDGKVFPQQLPHGGIQFEVSLGLFLTEEDAQLKGQFVERVTFENLATGEIYEGNKALIYSYKSNSIPFSPPTKWYASYNFYLGNSSKAKGDWEVNIHTMDAKIYSGHFTIDGSEIAEAAPIPVEVVTVQKIGEFFKVIFPVTNADFYNLRVLDGNDFIYGDRKDKPEATTTRLNFMIPTLFEGKSLEGKTVRIEARFKADRNPWPSLSPAGCIFSPRQYGAVRSSTYFLLKVLTE